VIYRRTDGRPRARAVGPSCPRLPRPGGHHVTPVRGGLLFDGRGRRRAAPLCSITSPCSSAAAATWALARSSARQQPLDARLAAYLCDRPVAARGFCRVRVFTRALFFPYLHVPVYDSALIRLNGFGIRSAFSSVLSVDDRANSILKPIRIIY